jgi:hypothetical protein
MKQDDSRSVFSLSHWNTQHRKWRCPIDETLAAFTERRLTNKTADRVRAHLADCEYCFGQVAFLVESEDREVPQVPAGLLARARESATRREPYRYPVWRWGTVAATVGCVALVGSLWLQRKDLPDASPAAPSASTTGIVVHPPVSVTAAGKESHKSVEEPVRDTRNEASHLVPALLVPEDGTSLSRAGLKFRWTGLSRVVFYDVRIVNAEGDLLWEEHTNDTRINIPPGLTLRPGQTYFVWVRAYLQEGKTVQSKAASFRIAKTD